MERYDLPAEKLATPEEAGVLRVAAETDEKNCGCKDAAITPSNLYSLLDCRKANTAYAAGVIVTCPYHKEFLLKCTTGGTTSANSIDTKSVTKGSVITDGSVKWTVIASQIIDLSISGKIITVTFIDGTAKTLTTQDTNTTYTAGTGLSLSSGKFSLASAYSNPITGASISGKVITLTFANGTTKTLTTQDTTGYHTGNATSIGGASATKPAVVVESYRSGDSWYRKYSDGWIEQGGKNTTSGETKNFLIPFTTKVCYIGLVASTPKGSATACQIYEASLTGFYPIVDLTSNYSYWIAMGV